ncbi:MAG: AMP-binding protein, partial [Burkholderiales bacterium]
MAAVATTTLAAIIDRNAREQPDALAVIFDSGRDSGRATHREHRDRVFQLANALIEWGLKRGDRFAVYSQNSGAYHELYGVAEATSLTLVTINWRLAPAEILAVLQDCTPALIAFESQFATVVDSLRHALDAATRFVCVGAAPVWAEPYDAVIARGASNEPVVPMLRPAPDDIAYLIYTS